MEHDESLFGSLKRALIRKANLIAKENEQFDAVVMSEAEKRLQMIVSDPQAGTIHDASVKLLNFVRFRTDQDKRVAELDRIISQTNPGKNFKQDLWDYAVLLSHGKQGDDPSEWVKPSKELVRTISGSLGN